MLKKTGMSLALVSFVMGIVFCSTTFGEPVSPEDALSAGKAFLAGERATWRRKGQDFPAPYIQKGLHRTPTIARIADVKDKDGNLWAYVVEMDQEGFIVVSADSDLRPILGYSFSGRFPFEDSRQNALLHLVQWDVSARQQCLHADPAKTIAVRASNNLSWKEQVSGNTSLIKNHAKVQQWPPDRDGWLSTNWYQFGPYNDKCPYTEVYNWVKQCAVGCTATAMAQIINYWQYPTTARFSPEPWPEGDGYTSMGSAGPFEIFGHAEPRHFPTCDVLNDNLDPIHYDGSKDEYLCFGVGVKLRMNYGEQSVACLSASSYLDGFGYSSARMNTFWEGGWYGLKDDVIANLKRHPGWPVQIGIRVLYGIFFAPGGHSVVVDGYRSDDFFHVNFGWSDTSCTTWYNIPDLYCYGHGTYNYIASIVYDIAPYRGWRQWGADARNSFSSPYAAPLDNILKWDQTSSADYFFSGLVVGTGNKVYAACSPYDCTGSYHPSVWVIDQYGTKLKEIVLENESESIAYPIQTCNGDLFVSTDAGRVYRINPWTDTATWIYTNPDAEQFSAPPKVDEDDYLYFATFYDVYSLAPSGAVRWTFPAGGSKIIYRKTPAIDHARDKVYITYYNSTNDKAYLGCIDRNSGALLCEREWSDIPLEGHGAKRPSIGPDGTVYMGCSHTLYALDPANLTGTPKWTKDFSPSLVPRSPVVGRDGTLYVWYGKNFGDTTYDLVFAALDSASEGATKWEVTWQSIDIWDGIDYVYAAANDVVTIPLHHENGKEDDTYEIYVYSDAGDHAVLEWSEDYGTIAGNELAFGPGATLYLISSPGGGAGKISAVSEGDTGNPEEAGMGFLNNHPPAFPTNPIPVDATEGVGTTVRLSWECVDPDIGHELKYDLFLGNVSAGGGEIAPIAGSLSSNSYELADVNPGSSYLWKVVANDGQAVTEGPIWSFTTLQDTHPADTNGDGAIDDFELLDYIDLWKVGEVDDFDLLDAVDIWKS